NQSHKNAMEIGADVRHALIQPSLIRDSGDGKFALPTLKTLGLFSACPFGTKTRLSAQGRQAPPMVIFLLCARAQRMYGYFGNTTLRSRYNRRRICLLKPLAS